MAKRSAAWLLQHHRRSFRHRSRRPAATGSAAATPPTKALRRTRVLVPQGVGRTMDPWAVMGVSRQATQDEVRRPPRPPPRRRPLVAAAVLASAAALAPALAPTFTTQPAAQLSTHTSCMRVQIKDQWRRLCKQHHPDLQVRSRPRQRHQPASCMHALPGKGGAHVLLPHALCPRAFPCHTARQTGGQLAARLSAPAASPPCPALPPAHPALRCLARASAQPEHMRHQAEQYFKEISSAYRTLTSRERAPALRCRRRHARLACGGGQLGRGGACRCPTQPDPGPCSR